MNVFDLIVFLVFIQSVTTEQEPEENKYTMLPVQELSSRFLMQQEKKKEQEAELVRKQKEEEVTVKDKKILRRIKNFYCYYGDIITFYRSLQLKK